MLVSLVGVSGGVRCLRACPDSAVWDVAQVIAGGVAQVIAGDVAQVIAGSCAQLLLAKHLSG